MKLPRMSREKLLAMVGGDESKLPADLRIPSAASLRVLRGRAKAKERAERFVLLLRASRVAVPTQEFRFWPGRKFAFDFAWPDQMVALESEGGAWSGGAHTRGAHFASDCLKYTEAAIRGWCVVRVLSGQLATDATVDLVRRALARPR